VALIFSDQVDAGGLGAMCGLIIAIISRVAMSSSDRITPGSRAPAKPG